MNWDTIAYNTCAFIAGLFLLEYGADKFLDHTVAAARRLNVSQTLIALLTAGAEWEELTVIVAANAQARSALALGNIIGSCVANVLGAFSLGLIFHPAAKIEFDRSAKIYTAVLLGLTTAFASLAAFLKPIGHTVGWILVAMFAVYIVGIGYGIYKGTMAPPDDHDDDSYSDSDSDSDSDATDNAHDAEKLGCTPNESFLPAEGAPTANAKVVKWQKHSLAYHVAYLILGFAALSISGYILSHSASTVGDALGMSETVLGITVLSFATTLPEKLVAIMSGARGHGGIIVANTAGSNIFLLTLCTGFLFLTTANFEELVSSIKVFDVATLWLSSLVLFLIVFFGARRWMGVGLFTVYIGFVMFELRSS